MKSKTYSHVQAIIQGTVWFLTGWFMAQVIVFPFFDNGGRISPLAAMLFMAIGAFFAGIFAANGGIISARKDYLNGKLKIDSVGAALKQAPAEGHNPWPVALRKGIVQWPIFAVLAFGLCFAIQPDGLSPKAFGLFTAHTWCVHSAILVRRTCIPELMRFLSAPQSSPIPFKRYLWTEHILGNALANVIINFGFGYILFHNGPRYPHPLVGANYFVADAFIMSAIISVFVALGAATQATTDLKAGRIAEYGDGKKKPGIVVRGAAYVAIALLAGSITKGALFALGIENITLLQAMLLKAVIAGVVATAGAATAARWGALPSRGS